MTSTSTLPAAHRPPARRLPPELALLIVLAAIALCFEILGWLLQGQSFLLNPRRLALLMLQVSTVGIIALGVTHVIIAGGIDLSSGSLVGATAMIAMSLAQTAGERALYPGLTDLPVVVPVAAGLLAGLACGLVNGFLIAYARIPPFIATLGMMVTARGFADWYTASQPISQPSPGFAALGAGLNPVWAMLAVALVMHVLLRSTRYGKYTYAIGANPQAARISGIAVERHLLKVYAVAGLLAGLAGLLLAARVQTAQSAMGTMYELDAIAIVVIGGVSLSGGRGSIPGTLIGMLIFGVILAGLGFLRVDPYYQDMLKGAIIIAAVLLDLHRQRGPGPRG